MIKIAIVGFFGADTLEQNLYETFLTFEKIDVKQLNLGNNYYLKYLKFFSPKIGNFVHKFIGRIKSNKFVTNLKSKKMTRILIKFQPDIIIILTGAANSFSANQIKQLKKGIDTYIICWFVDASINIRRGIFLRAPYDIIFFTDQGLVDWFKPLLESRVELLLEGHLHEKHSNSERLGDEVKNYFVIVGTLYPERYELVRKLAQMGFPIKIYGPPLPSWSYDSIVEKNHTNRYIVHQEKSFVFKNALGVINNFHPTHINAINCRVFEVLSSGGLLISEQSNLLRETIDASAYLAYDNFNALTEILNNILEDSSQFESIKIKAKYISSAHSLQIRAQNILEYYENFRTAKL